MVALRILPAVLMLALAALATPAAADVPDPVVTHCVADETGVAYCSTTVAGTCTVTSVGGTPSSASCDRPEPPACSFGPTTPGGDTHCEASVAECDVLVHIYDQEDALNRYKADCGCAGYDNYGRPALRADC